MHILNRVRQKQTSKIKNKRTKNKKIVSITQLDNAPLDKIVLPIKLKIKVIIVVIMQ